VGARKVSVTTGVGAGFEVTKGVVGVSRASHRFLDPFLDLSVRVAATWTRSLSIQLKLRYNGMDRTLTIIRGEPPIVRIARRQNAS
jgi:hypothetical protein